MCPLRAGDGHLERAGIGRLAAIGQQLQHPRSVAVIHKLRHADRAANEDLAGFDRLPGSASMQIARIESTANQSPETCEIWRGA
jgi:hypothetical protein